MDVLTSETCWALYKEIIKQVTSSWSLFTQVSFKITRIIVVSLSSNLKFYENPSSWNRRFSCRRKDGWIWRSQHSVVATLAMRLKWIRLSPSFSFLWHQEIRLEKNLLSGKPLTIPVARVLRKFIRREKFVVEMLLGHVWVGVKQYGARAKAVERRWYGYLSQIFVSDSRAISVKYKEVYGAYCMNIWSHIKTGAYSTWDDEWNCAFEVPLCGVWRGWKSLLSSWVRYSVETHYFEKYSHKESHINLN